MNSKLRIPLCWKVGLTPDEIKNFKLSDYGPRLSFKFYEKKFAEVLGRAITYADFQQLTNCLNVVAQVRKPLMAIHSHQDNWMGYQHAEELKSRAAGNPNVMLHYVDGAGHASYFIHDPVWFHHLLQSYFGYWLEPAAAPAQHAYLGDKVTGGKPAGLTAETPQQKAADASAEQP